jgi:integrase
MVRAIGKLSPAQVRHATKPGLYGDGAGLWLHVGPTGGKSWLYRYMLAGRARGMGLGPLHTIGLAEARERAAAARRLCLDGIDPLEARRADRVGRAAKAAAIITFSQAAARYIETHRAAWRNTKHAGQWGATLATYAFPVIGDLSVADVDAGHVTAVLVPIWTSKTETASRVRSRIELVLDYAAAHGWRSGENPARWKGHLRNVLPNRAKVAPVEHYPALPWQQIGAFMAELEKQGDVVALALRFLILTACRTGDVVGAVWAEIALDDAIWTIPGRRTKAGREHRVPLSEAAIEILKRLPGGDGPVFPGRRAGSFLPSLAMRTLLHRTGRRDLTVHGFRSCFKDWASETGWAADVSEASLAHTIGNKTVAAYQRGDLLERRRSLLEAWAAFCARAEPATAVRSRRAGQFGGLDKLGSGCH